jgi:hypothetical protein
MSFGAIAAFCLVYGYGATVEINCLLDHSPAESHTATVDSKRMIRGKTTTYEVSLGPWGPRATPNRLRVNRAEFNAIQPGDEAHISLKRGALGINWYYVLAWQRSR